MSNGMIIDGVFASEAIDSSGEILDIKGCDISDLENGLGVLNWEHRGDDASGASANDIIGKIVFCKKIYGAEDCTDEHQLKYWQKVQLPMIYGICRLFDGSGHPGAIAAAAMIRDYQKNGEPILIRFSIEGTTLHKDKSNNRLTDSVARRVAATIKPCNKSCHSGLLSDPNDPTVTKKEHAHPMFTPLGGSFEYESSVLESERIEKALTAGSTAGAPSTLTDGSALQREDKFLRNRVKAAVRDWDKKTPFRKFLKHRLPEASDDFIDRFSDLVGDYTIKKTQREVLKAELIKAAKEKLGLTPPPADVKPGRGKKAPKVVEEFTIQGRPTLAHDPRIHPLGPRSTAMFDENAGTLNTRAGIFRASTPTDPHPHLLADLEARGVKDPRKLILDSYNKAIGLNRSAFQQAMKHWVPLNKQFIEGKLTPGIISHVVAFALMSPSNKVPVQEYMFGNYRDAMAQHGLSSVQTPEQARLVHSEWLKRNRQIPQSSPEHFSQLMSKLFSEGGLRTYAGAPPGYAKPNQFSKYFEEYLKNNHADVMNAVRNSKGDAHEVVRQLVNTRGMDTKLARYMMGILGAGNVVVNDTHMIRHLFGARPDLAGHRAGSSPDTRSLTHLKQTFGTVNAGNALESIDRWFAKNHPAIQYAMADPVLRKHLAQHPEQALFPAFWLHWMSIPHHEKMMGYEPLWASNQGTSHAPFFEAIQPEMIYKSEEQDESGDLNMAMATAKLHHEWIQKYGPEKALELYYKFIVPKYMEKEQEVKVDPNALVAKFESLSIEFNALTKAKPFVMPDTGETPPETDMGSFRHTTPPSQESWRQPQSSQPQTGDTPRVNPAKIAKEFRDKVWAHFPDSVEFQGKKVKPGKAFIGATINTPWGEDQAGGDRKVGILGHDDTHFTIVPSSKITNYMPEDMIRIPRHHLRVVEYPSYLEEKPIIQDKLHTVGDFTHHPETQAMIHGLDLSLPRQASGVESLRKNLSHWQNGPNGTRVFIKQDPEEEEFGESRREGMYHNLARDFFGMDQYVTPTTVVRDPKSGREMSVIQHTEGTHPEQEQSNEHANALDAHNANGELHKLGLMNTILGNPDRHWENYFIDDKGRIKLIDHGLAFNYQPFSHRIPHYIKGYLDHSLHPEAQSWLNKLKPEELIAQMRRHGAPDNMIQGAVDRLKGAKNYMRNYPKGNLRNLLNTVGTI